VEQVLDLGWIAADAEGRQLRTSVERQNVGILVVVGCDVLCCGGATFWCGRGDSGWHGDVSLLARP
jgi:hypothetical protein